MPNLALALLLLFAVPGVAHAYVGPGLGAGAIGAVVGVIGAVLLALFSIVYYPVKRAMRRRRAAQAPEPAPTAAAEVKRP
jgi:membrane associated rhomboid family serine protease